MKATIDDQLKGFAISMYINGYHDRIAGSSLGVTPGSLGHAEPIMEMKVAGLKLAIYTQLLELTEPNPTTPAGEPEMIPAGKLKAYFNIEEVL